MNKKKFYGFQLLFLLIFILSIVIAYSIEEVESEFMGVGISVFWLSLWLFEIKNANKPLRRSGEHNSLKRMYQSKNKLDKYKKICKVIFVIFLVMGAISLLEGIKGLFLMLF